eukprot:TRINITY_DN10997_c0_g1_i1.p3 TRINITY_DN10997_c0_g1~~TRINITY_DN10997_c0_g1_i1.p3  ORF type:complete len:145 (+),score=29.36 TRINITY_DN10997_c0_g1_i1:1846-2280(+)
MVDKQHTLEAITARLSGKAEDKIGLCKKCGFAGHLTFQCRNYIKVDAQHDVHLDVSSTSSEDSDYLQEDTGFRSRISPSERLKRRRHDSPRRKSRSGDDSDDDSDDERRRRERKAKRKSKKHKKEKKKKHKKEKKSKHSRRDRD